MLGGAGRGRGPLWAHIPLEAWGSGVRSPHSPGCVRSDLLLPHPRRNPQARTARAWPQPRGPPLGAPWAPCLAPVLSGPVLDVAGWDLRSCPRVSGRPCTGRGRGWHHARQPRAPRRIPFFRFCSQCGRSVGVRLAPCARCYGILTCSKSCRARAWTSFHKRDCAVLLAIGEPRGWPPGQGHGHWPAGLLGEGLHRPPKSLQANPLARILRCTCCGDTEARSQPGTYPHLMDTMSCVSMAPWGGPAWTPQSEATMPGAPPDT